MDNSKAIDVSDTFTFPPEWQDDSRMNVMFSPFRPKSLDPIAWESKFKFWDLLIKRYCIFHKISSFSVAFLKKAFIRNGKSPSCLENVVEELLLLKKIDLAENYNNYSLTQESLVSWLVKSMVKSPLNWTLNKIKTPFSSQPDPVTVNYVYTSVAKEIGEDCLKKLSNEHKGKLMLLTNFNEITGIKNDDTLIILKPLILNKQVAVSKIGDDFVIKVAKKDEKSVEITEVDIGVFQLEKNETSLQETIENLENEVEEAMAKVRFCLKNNRKQMAKSWLRRKKELDKYIEKRANALDNIRSLLEKLKQTESDALVLDSYRLGIKALKNSLSENGLNEERADSTLNELQDVLDVTKDIEDCLSRPLDPNIDTDLEQELESLLEDAQAPPGDSPGGTFNISSLPDVPSTLDQKFEDRLKELSL